MKHAIFSLFLLVLASSCQFFETEKISTETFYEEEIKAIDWKDVDQYPVFAECSDFSEKKALRSCFESTLSNNLYQSIQTRNIVASQPLLDTLMLEFLVSENATLSVVNIKMDSLTRKQFPRLENWLVQHIDSLALVAPAYKRGIPVKTHFTLPVVLQTH
ncbi:MAG: hypothetical protein MK211_09645 [Flavobacteriales bacterium]|jgi:hypothetical protein|uniref:hypothetical protein n=1 Tax=Candidatus Ulvibacter alkanivorans TaxID=2267620 RepID=UPI000DF1FA2A|nr:hypothetical protein [Candidatus Ulvibacter alkanivorans]MCH2490399.1 hypothetical protein [Flavobacteriales bacterium]